MNKKSVMMPLIMSRRLTHWLLPLSGKFIPGHAVRVGDAYNLVRLVRTKAMNENEENEEAQAVDASSDVVKRVPTATISGRVAEVSLETLIADADRAAVGSVNDNPSAATGEPAQDVRDKLDEQMRQVQEQLRRQKDRDAQQRQDRMERHRLDIIKMQRNRPAVERNLKIDFNDFSYKGRYNRQERLDMMLKECKDVNTLSEMVVRLTRDLEDDRLKYKKHMDEYYQLITTFTTAKKRLTNEIVETKAMGNKQLIHELLELADDLEFDDSDGADLPLDEQAQKLHGTLAKANATLEALFKRNGVIEIDAKGKQFDHNYHHLAGVEILHKVPSNTVLEVTKKGYMLRDHCIRLAHVIVSRCMGPQL